MKYCVETTDNGYIEILEFGGKVYTKKWTLDGSVARSKDKDFAEQMEVDGFIDEVLDSVYDKIDCTFFAKDIFDIYEEFWC